MAALRSLSFPFRFQGKHASPSRPRKKAGRSWYLFKSLKLVSTQLFALSLRDAVERPPRRRRQVAPGPRCGGAVEIRISGDRFLRTLLRSRRLWLDRSRAIQAIARSGT